MEKTLIQGKMEGKKRQRRQRIRWLDSITEATDMNLSKSWETVKDREAWHATIHGVTVRHDLVTEKQQIVDLQYYMFQLYNIVI